MSKMICPREDAVARAVRTDSWDETLSQHARECPVCRDVSTAVAWMNQLAAQPAEAAALPEASLVWWRHELMERARRRERAQRPLQVMEALSTTLALVVTAGALSWLATNLSGEVAALAARATPHLLLAAITAGESANGGLLYYALLGALAAVGIASVLLYPLLREE